MFLADLPDISYGLFARPPRALDHPSPPLGKKVFAATRSSENKLKRTIQKVHDSIQNCKYYAEKRTKRSTRGECQHLDSAPNVKHTVKYSYLGVLAILFNRLFDLVWFTWR